jgi:DNA adenine methylase
VSSLDHHASGGVSERAVLPFLKWAGGKRWLVRDHSAVFDVSFDRYLEPFIGSGAVFFSLLPGKAVISDSNEELILTYQAVRDDWRPVWAELERMHRMHSKEFYYAVRKQKPQDSSVRAARFLYLNRTCWNALNRVNQKGEFNVPIGTKTDVLAGGDLSACANALRNAEIVSCDFGATMREAGPGDLVFVDPPYTVRHNVNGFLKYNQTLFSWDDQVRLRDEVVAARGRGAAVVVSNAAHESVIALYDGVGEISVLERASVISGAAHGRKREKEILVRCI